MAGALAGYRVIDLSSMISGPVATMILGDQGADVIKVEKPDGGDHVRRGANRRADFAANFVNNNRSKRSLVLDLKKVEGLGVLYDLIESADVFVQNFRPGVAERMGLGYERLCEIKPDLIYLSIAGFGFNGPYATKPVYDPLIQAVSGLATVQAGSDEERPRLVRTIVPDKVSGLTAAQAVTAALLHRERSGEGQHVQLAMLDAIVAFLWHSDMGSQTFIGDELPQQSAASFIDLIYATSAGYISVATMSDREWAGACRAFDKPEWVEDERFKSPALRDRNINARLELVQSVLLTRPASEWLQRLEAENVPCAPVLTRNEMMRHPQVEANGIVQAFTHPQAGQLRQTRPPAQFSVSTPEIVRAAPALGEHSEEVLKEIGYDDARIKDLREASVVGGGAS